MYCRDVLVQWIIKNKKNNNYNKNGAHKALTTEVKRNTMINNYIPPQGFY